MSLQIVQGKPGSGKSYHTVTMLLQYLEDWALFERKEGLPFERVLYTNLPLNTEAINEYQTKKTGDTIPPADKSVLTLPGLLVKDSHIYYVGSLKRKDSRCVFSLFGIDAGKSNYHLTVWFRVRELKK